LLLEAAYAAEIPTGEIGFDENPVHFMADIYNYSRPQVAKLLRGPSAKRFFEHFPEAKRKYFWGSGLWNPSYYIGSPKNLDGTINYIKKQKYGEKGIGKSQMTLSSYAS
jgi:REP element-mobilizing transposase RayT